jgi:hypothetical protein
MNRAEREDERETLSAIASMLLSLAVLAEFLCLLLLWLRVSVPVPLRPAEAVTRAFAFHQMGGAASLAAEGFPGHLAIAPG